MKNFSFSLFQLLDDDNEQRRQGEKAKGGEGCTHKKQFQSEPFLVNANFMISVWRWKFSYKFRYKTSFAEDRKRVR